MKNIITTFLIIASVTTMTQSCNEKKSSDAVILVHSRAGRCLKSKGGCAVAIYNKNEKRTLSESDMGISIQKNSDSTLQIDYNQKFESEDGDNFFVDKEIIIPQSTCTNLGQNSIKIERGEYKIDRTKSKLGRVIVKATFD